MTINKYQNKINDVKNDKIKKSLIELTKYLKKNEKNFNYYSIFFMQSQILAAEEIKRIVVGTKMQK